MFISDGDTRRTASGDASSRKKLPQVLPYGTPAAAKAAVEAAEKLHVEEERQKMQERKRVDEANRKRMQEVERKKLQEEERKRLEEAEKKRIEKSEHKRKEEEEEKKKLEDQKRKEEEKKRAEEEEGRRQTELEREKNRDKAATAIQRRVRGMGARMVIGWKQEAAKEIQRRARGMIARNEVAAAIAEQKAAQTEAHVSEENAAAVAIQLRECGMTTSKKAAAKHKGGVDHVPDHHVQGRIHETIQDLEKSAHVDLGMTLIWDCLDERRYVQWAL